VSFSHAVSLGSDLTSDLASVRRAIDASGATGLTSIVDAAFAGLTLGASDSGRSLMLVFSDGVDTSSWLEPKAVIDAAKRSNVVVFGVDRRQIARSVSQGSGRSQRRRSRRGPEDQRCCESTFVKLLAEYRLRYIVGYSPTGVDDGRLAQGASLRAAPQRVGSRFATATRIAERLHQRRRTRESSIVRTSRTTTRRPGCGR
jgi:hypothetical protein